MSNRSETIEIPWIGPSLNTVWAGRHWSFRKKVADDAHIAVSLATKGVKPFNGPVALVFRPMIKGRRFDASNYSLTFKAIEDGLVLAGIIEGDGFKTVRRVTLYAPEITKEKSHCLVEISGHAESETFEGEQSYNL